MAYKEIVSLDADTTIALGGRNKKTGKANPTEAEGYYLGSRRVSSPKSKNGFAYIHFLQTATGTLGVWGKTDLDRKVLDIVPGTMTLLAFDKMVPTPNGEMYKFKVAVDKDNTTDVSTLVSGSSDAGVDASGENQDDSDVEDYDADAESLAAAARQAKLQELLKGAGKSGSRK